jgi:hypothetical protein
VHAYICFLEHEQLEPSRNQESVGSAATNIASTTLRLNASSTVSTAVSTTSYSGIESRGPSTPDENEAEPQPDDKDLKENKGKIGTSYESSGYLGGLVLVTVSGGGDFDAVKKWSDGVIKVFRQASLFAAT